MSDDETPATAADMPPCDRCDHPAILHTMGPARACSGIFCGCHGYSLAPVNQRPACPNLGQALAEAVKDRIEIGRDVQRVERSLGNRDGYITRSDLDWAARHTRLKEVEQRVDALEFALVAHTYEWAHDHDDCPVCEGEVTL